MFKRKKSDSGTSNNPFSAFGGKRQAGRKPIEVFEDFKRMPLPDAIDGVMFRASMADPADPFALSGFERYAARAFSEVDSARLRAIAVEHPMETCFLAISHIFWIRFDASGMAPEDRAVVLHAESVLNRLALLTDLIKDDADEMACSEADWATFRQIADNAVDIIDNTSRRATRTENYHGAQALKGGNWDIFLRFASACESAAVPFRLEYRYDCDAASGVLAADVTLPSPSFFPRSRWDRVQNRWIDVSSEQANAAAAYNLRFIVRVAAMAFGCSLGVRHVVISGHEVGLDSSAAMSFEFDRTAFLAETAPSTRAKSFSDPRFTCDPAAIFSLVKPMRWALAPDASGNSTPVEKIRATLPERRIPIEQDTRPLPAGMAQLLHAERVCDLDVLSIQDAELDERVSAAQADAADSPLLACAQLEEIIANAEAQTRSDEGELPELYCDGTFSRMLVSLVEPNPDVRYRRASDQVQNARSALAALYSELGNHEGAIEQARKCLAVAPSSPDAHLDLINAYAAAERYAEAADIAKRALGVAVADTSVSYLYYRLAYALWKTGHLDEGIACYLRVSPSHNIADVARQELSELMREAGCAKAPDRSEVEATLRAAGIPCAPTEAALSVLAKVAVAHCDAGIPLVAAPAAAMIAQIKHDDIVTSMSTAMKRGV